MALASIIGDLLGRPLCNYIETSNFETISHQPKKALLYASAIEICRDHGDC